MGFHTMGSDRVFARWAPAGLLYWVRAGTVTWPSQGQGKDHDGYKPVSAQGQGLSQSSGQKLGQDLSWVSTEMGPGGGLSRTQDRDWVWVRV